MLIVKRHGGSVSKINPHMSNLQEENHLKVMRLLVEDPRMNQRELATALGMSLGKTNYCLKALMGKGLIKVNNFRSHKNKLAYAYLLTPQGIAEKANLTAEFLRRKLDEYERLKDEIQMLKREVLTQGNLGWPGADY